MEIDPSQPDPEIIKQKSEALQSLVSGSVSTSISKLAGSSRGIPSDKDFHFYYLFDDFRAPIDEIAAASKAMLEKIGSSEQLWGSGNANFFPGEDIDEDAAYNWLVSVNDEVLERLDVSFDEFLKMRKEQEGGKKGILEEDGFQLVTGKKKKAAIDKDDVDMRGEGSAVSLTSVRLVEKDKKAAAVKPKVPFHIPTIRRPQDEYNILVNNKNKPFEHVWLQKSEDGARFVHPLEKLSVSDFVDRKISEPSRPAPLESTPFKMVETVKDLKEMVRKLRDADEIAVDLEHNQYRSFQGLTCLMQISTRTEDFLVDTLKLRIHIGPHLREIFKDPSKKKVMHGANQDVVWLQRDFGIYICNLFDTGQASRVLKLERFSLEYLLQHFCQVTATKEYQNADWRLRPLPLEMIRYAREDTHYLLYIYDLMRERLISESTGNEKSDDLLLEVYQRSHDVCMQMYEKELLTDTSYLHLYGLQTANFNAQQLSVVSGLYEWRDKVARDEDESTGYILPNKTLLEIAKQLPVTTSKLRKMVWHRHPYIERNLSSVVSIIRHSMQHSAPFEAVVKQLAEARSEVATPLSEAPPESVSSAGEQSLVIPNSSKVEKVNDTSSTEAVKSGGNSSLDTSPNDTQINAPNGSATLLTGQSPAVDGTINVTNASHSEPKKATGATVQILKKPGGMFGALLGSSTSKRKADPSKKENELTKLEQIRSSVNLPFHSFVGDDQKLKNAPIVPSETIDAPHLDENCGVETESSNLGDVILFSEHPNDEDKSPANSSDPTATEQRETGEDDGPAEADVGEEDELMSLSDLSSTLSKCIQSSDQNQPDGGSAEPSGLAQFKPFDYEEARKAERFEGGRGSKGDGSRGGGRNRSDSKKGGSVQDQQAALPQGRRRHAFPASGNRSATFL